MYSHGSGKRQDFNKEPSTVTIGVQTDITMNDMNQYDEKPQCNSFLSTIMSSDKKVNYYTGIPDLTIFLVYLIYLVIVLT